MKIKVVFVVLSCLLCWGDARAQDIATKTEEPNARFFGDTQSIAEPVDVALYVPVHLEAMPMSVGSVRLKCTIHIRDSRQDVQSLPLNFRPLRLSQDRSFHDIVAIHVRIPLSDDIDEPAPVGYACALVLCGDFGPGYPGCVRPRHGGTEPRGDKSDDLIAYPDTPFNPDVAGSFEDMEPNL